METRISFRFSFSHKVHEIWPGEMLFIENHAVRTYGVWSNASHLSASSGRSPHFRLTPESVQTVLGRCVSLSLSGTTRPQHLPTAWILIHQPYLQYTSLHTLQMILTSDNFINIYILFYYSIVKLSSNYMVF
jgi:hypothetical protein